MRVEQLAYLADHEEVTILVWEPAPGGGGLRCRGKSTTRLFS